MKAFNIKEEFNSYGWNIGFKFEITYSKSGVARIYLGSNRKTKYTVTGYGYDKESSVIATMINDLLGRQPYDKYIYGNSGNNNLNQDLNFLSGGTGLSSIKESFESIEGYKLNKIYSGVNSDVFEISFK